MAQNIDESKKKAFWKRSSNKFPGSSMQSSPAPQHESPQHAPKHKLSFKEFENHTEDAWDATDDDLLRAALAKIEMGSSPEQVHAAAQAVIENHSKTNSFATGSRQTSTLSSGHQKLAARTSAEKPVRPGAAETTPTSSHSHKRVPGGASRTVSQVGSIPVHKVVKDKQPAKSMNGFGNLNNSSEVYETNAEETTQTGSKMVLSPPSITGAGSAPKAQSIRMPMTASNLAKENTRIDKFYQMLQSDSIDLDDLRKLSWPGIPSAVRAVTWKLLSGYLPANKDRRESVLKRKRNEYFKFVEQYYECREQPMYQQTYHQIHIDIPRTNPLIPLFQQPSVQTVFERLLFVWAVRHPASGYVQGINDLVTPFFVVFLSAEIGEEVEVETYDVAKLPERTLKDMEADTYWCMGNLLDGIQDNYTFAQPGVQSKVSKLRELTKRVDADLHAHLETEQIEYLQFSFRWMNNLLMREIPLRCTIRLWDTYLAETDGFSDFHLYVCAAFLTQWRKQLLAEKDFQGVMLMIQNVPTHHWGDEEVKLLLAEAYRLKYTFADAPSHLPNKKR
uniref:TBC1 domain family member 22B-like n=1 Tax=Phallusia mammillata TaxID=59560 RepID=A0A6F9DUZ6_9ASCI|nr:TBC1 domain family member 22B-like [Phallusia mammillata]